MKFNRVKVSEINRKDKKRIGKKYNVKFKSAKKAWCYMNQVSYQHGLLNI